MSHVNLWCQVLIPEELVVFSPCKLNWDYFCWGQVQYKQNENSTQLMQLLLRPLLSWKHSSEGLSVKQTETWDVII